MKSETKRKEISLKFVKAKNCLLLFTTGFLPSVAAQQLHPALTNTISYTSLIRRAAQRQLEWTNPNGVTERMMISEMSIPIDEKMQSRTRDFNLANYGIDSVWLHPKIVVFHAMGDGDLKTSLEVSSFLNDEIPASWGNLPKAGKLPNGAHFIIEKNGNVICLTPPVSSDGKQISYVRDHHQWWIKRHQDGNPVAIGIENVTDAGNFIDLTPEQIESNARLTRWLIWMEDNKIRFLTSHHQFNSDEDYTLFQSAFRLKHLQKKYRTTGRKDIGDRNLGEIIQKVNDYGWSVQSFFTLK